MNARGPGDGTAQTDSPKRRGKMPPEHRTLVDKLTNRALLMRGLKDEFLE